ncbi:MAG: hypothetical protein ACP5R4_04475 [Armatimonadota bacterium]
MIDDGFIQKTRTTTFWLTAWLSAWLAIGGCIWYLNGLVAGVALSLFSLWSLEKTVDVVQFEHLKILNRGQKELRAPGRRAFRRIRRGVLFAAVVKYLVFFALLKLLFDPPRVSLGAFLVGVFMPHLVMLLLALGQMFSPISKSSRG